MIYREDVNPGNYFLYKDELVCCKSIYGGHVTLTNDKVVNIKELQSVGVNDGFRIIIENGFIQVIVDGVESEKVKIKDYHLLQNFLFEILAKVEKLA